VIVLAKFIVLAGITEQLNNYQPIDINVLSTYREVHNLSSNVEDEFTQAVKTYNYHLKQS
jgi:hypothetical protein